MRFSKWFSAINSSESIGDVKTASQVEISPLSIFKKIIKIAQAI